MSVVEFGHIAIRKAVALRFKDIGHRFQKLMSLDGAGLYQLHEIRPYTIREAVTKLVKFRKTWS